MSKDSLKLFGLVAFAVIVSGFASSVFAQEAAAAASSGEMKNWLAIAAGFGMAIATVGGAMAQSKAVSTALDGVARNPGAAGKMLVPMLLGLALIESLVLFSFLVTNGLAGKI